MKPTTRTLVIILSALILAIMLSPVVMGGLMGSGTMMPGMMWGSGTGGAGHLSGWTWGLMLAFGGLRAIAIVAALIVGVLLLVRALTQRSGEHRETALELLQRRYAAGEISPAEYEHMRQQILPSTTMQPR